MFRLRSLAASIAIILTSSATAQPGPDMWTDARSLTLQLSSFQFNPADLRLEHGVAYDLHIVNNSSGGHNFTAGEFFAQARIKPEDRAKINDGRIEVGGRKSVDVHLVAPSPGNYRMRCTHFMHSAFGMTGQIIVQ